MVEFDDPAVVVVNDEVVPFSGLIRELAALDDLDLFNRCARRHLIGQLAEREGVHIDQDTLQAEVNEWRYKHQLDRAEDTDEWLAARGVALCEVASIVENRLLCCALAERVTKGRIEPYFAEHTLDFDEVELCWISVADEAIAEELAIQMTEESRDFYAFALRYSNDSGTRPACGFMGRLRRSQLPVGVSPLLFAASPGTIVGPVRIEKGFGLYLVRNVYRATLAATVRKEIRDILFERWLEREMRDARIGYPFKDNL